MKLYHCSKTRSVRVLWLLEELGLDYELETLPFDPQVLNSPDYLAINPFGTVPALVDGDLTLLESGAIVQYLLARYGDGILQPDTEDPEFGPYLQWLHFGEGTLMVPIANIATHTFKLPEDERVPREIARGKKSLARYAAVLDKELSQRPYLAGDEFTAADILVGYAVLLMKLFHVMPDGNPHLVAWFQRLKQRPAFQLASQT